MSNSRSLVVFADRTPALIAAAAGGRARLNP